MKRLPDSELEIMQAIWSFEPPVYRTDIESILKEVHPMAPTTLFTLLTRLSEKGFIRIEKVNRSADYYPLITQEEYLADQGNRFFKKMCHIHDSFLFFIYPHTPCPCMAECTHRYVIS